MAGPVLVTGAAGFAGRHLLDLLKTDVVAGFSRPSDVVGWTRADVDLLDRDRVRAAIAGLRPAQVYHFAGAAHVAESWADTAGTLASNVLATHQLLDALRLARVSCRVVIPGSAHVYAPSDTPLDENAPLATRSPYAVSKLAQEQLGARAVVEDGVETILTRSFNHTGPRQTPSYVAPSIARQIALIERGAAEPVIKVGNLDSRRDLGDVRDTVRAYAMLMERGTPGTIYNVATGVAVPTRALLDALVARSRVPVRIENDPERMRPNDVPVLVGDPTRLREATGWQPMISFEQMVDDLLNYWRAA